jgi:hypothetical protein
MIAVYIDGAFITWPQTPHFMITPNRPAWSMGKTKSGTIILFQTAKNIPTGGHHEKIPQAGQGKTSLMQQKIYTLDLGNFKVAIESIVGAGFPVGIDEPLLFIFANPLLRQVDLSGYIVDAVHVSLHGALRRSSNRGRLLSLPTGTAPQSTVTARLPKIVSPGKSQADFISAPLLRITSTPPNLPLDISPPRWQNP